MYDDASGRPLETPPRNPTQVEIPLATVVERPAGPVVLAVEAPEQRMIMREYYLLCWKFRSRVMPTQDDIPALSCQSYFCLLNIVTRSIAHNTQQRLPHALQMQDTRIPRQQVQQGARRAVEQAQQGARIAIQQARREARVAIQQARHDAGAAIQQAQQGAIVAIQLAGQGARIARQQARHDAGAAIQLAQREARVAR